MYCYQCSWGAYGVISIVGIRMWRTVSCHFNCCRAYVKTTTWGIFNMEPWFYNYNFQTISVQRNTVWEILFLWKDTQFEKYYFLQCRRHCLCHTRKENGPLTRQEERAIAATEKRLTRAEAVQEYEQSFIFDQEKFTFRELSVFLMTMQAWGAATISCKGTWQKIGGAGFSIVRHGCLPHPVCKKVVRNKL